MSNDDSPLPDTEVHHLRSEHVGDEFKLLVGPCGSLESTDATVLVLGDPWAAFGTAVEMIRILQLSDDLPPLLVVGVGYRVAAMEDNFVLRCRDFTPTVDLASGYDDPAMMAGAGRFLAFLSSELKPWVHDRYGVDVNDATYFGYSLGGLFGTYVLLHEPATFRRYGIGSPSLYWDGGVTFMHEEAYAQAHDDLAAKVFVSVGAWETPEGDRRYIDQLPAEKRAKAEAEADPSIDMVVDSERLVALLRERAYPSLELEYQVMPDEYHHTCPPLSMSRSLRYLFDAPR